ncbi:glycosyltransferase family 9 protein [Paraflavitalea soli]|nr:glycosyltransferase family 9 protein [Paraflavitalea soli]
MTKILLIKTGAAGDVVRTTTLLRVLKGAITWVIDPRYAHILPDNHPELQRIIPIEQAAHVLKNESFDLTLSLEEDIVCAKLASNVPTGRLIGIHMDGDLIRYTDDVAGWFDMSLVSKLGRAAANKIKAANTHTFQYWLFNMLGLSFQGQPYCIYRNPAIEREEQLIGIETRSGNRWPNKSWAGYQALTGQLTASGYRCLILSQRDHLRDYLDDIARCAYLISGDTLAMHVALAYNIPALAIFNCTSPAEIYDYGLLQKIVSPLLQQSFYGREYTPEVIASVSPREVHDCFRQHIAFRKEGQKA